MRFFQREFVIQNVCIFSASCLSLMIQMHSYVYKINPLLNFNEIFCLDWYKCSKNATLILVVPGPMRRLCKPLVLWNTLMWQGMSSSSLRNTKPLSLDCTLRQRASEVKFHNKGQSKRINRDKCLLNFKIPYLADKHFTYFWAIKTSVISSKKYF